MKHGNLYARRYLELQDQIKTLSDELGTLKALFKTQGSFNTVDYVVSIKERHVKAYTVAARVDQVVSVAPKTKAISLDDIATEILPSELETIKKKA